MPPTPAKDARLAEAIELIVGYMQKRDQEERQMVESLKVLPELVTSVTLLTEQVRDLKEGQHDHEEILHGKGDEPGLVGKFNQQKTDVDRINGYIKIVIGAVLTSSLLMVLNLFLQHGTAITP